MKTADELRHEPNEECDGTTATNRDLMQCPECEEIYCHCEMVAGHRCWNM